ncbi:MAG TPA: hypothetical protein VNJ50_03440 [Gelidibacter sp.]|nr:hypothetical protein [Gelidibacter sp.]HXJ97875.1 hypothetical protein [Gelidibacter sp.]
MKRVKRTFNIIKKYPVSKEVPRVDILINQVYVELDKIKNEEEIIKE